MSETTGSLTPPPPVYRHKLHLWAFERGLSLPALAQALGNRQQRLEIYMLPPNHPRYEEPGLKFRKLVRAYTAGAVTLDDWPEKVAPSLPSDRREPRTSPRASRSGGAAASSGSRRGSTVPAGCG